MRQEPFMVQTRRQHYSEFHRHRCPIGLTSYRLPNDLNIYRAKKSDAFAYVAPLRDTNNEQSLYSDV